MFVNFRFSASTNVRTRGVQAGETIRIASSKSKAIFVIFRRKGGEKASNESDAFGKDKAAALFENGRFRKL